MPNQDVSLLTIAVTLILAFGGCTRANVSDVAPAAPVALVELEDVYGNSQRFSERGQISIVNFWATWCAPCVAEMPELQVLHEGHKRDGLIVIGVSSDSLTDSSIAAFAENLDITYPIIRDDGSAAEAAGSIIGYPTTLIIDQNGQEVRRILGATTARELEGTIQELLGKH